MMKNLYRLIILLLVISFTACTSNQPYMSAANDEDKDIGLGGTGMLAAADSDSDNGLGGTGVLGEITGFGSIFVNGIEIEYDRKTTFTIDGKSADYQQLEIGDVVEVLTTDRDKHTQAQVINLRHEIIGKVEAIDPQTFSFTVLGQTVIQPVNNRILPGVGAMVAVSGFRIDKNTIISTRVAPTDAKQTLLRTQTGLPFENKTTHWLVQLHVQNNKAVFQLAGTAHVLNIKEKTKKTYADLLGIRILQLRSPAASELKLERVVDLMEIPRGQGVSVPMQRRGGNTLLQPGSGSMPGPGTSYGSGAGTSSGSGQSPQPAGPMQR